MGKVARTEVIAHRGAGGPENTLAAFRRAKQLGADWFECDVRLCASGELVVIHDRTVDRTTSGTGRVDELPLHALLRLDAGGSQRIPTLQQALALTTSRFGAYIEAKVQGNAQALAHAVVAQARGRVVVQSFDREFCRLARELSPRLRIELLLSTRPKGGWQHALDFAVSHSLHGVNLSLRAASRGLVQNIHAAGLRCTVYTVNEAAAMRRLARWGADALITDKPEQCIAALPAAAKD